MNKLAFGGTKFVFKKLMDHGQNAWIKHDLAEKKKSRRQELNGIKI